MKLYSDELRPGDVIDGWTVAGVRREGAESETVVLSVEQDGVETERRIEAGAIVEASRNP